MLVFTTSLGTPGVSTTNGTPNTETGVVSLKTASQGRNISLFAASVQGRATILTTLSGIVFRVITATTASTGGTAATPFHADATANVTATAVAATGQTISATGRRNHMIFGCSVSGPGGFMAGGWPINDAAPTISPNATAPSVDIVSASATASLTFEFAAQHAE